MKKMSLAAKCCFTLLFATSLTNAADERCDVEAGYLPNDPSMCATSWSENSFFSVRIFPGGGEIDATAGACSCVTGGILLLDYAHIPPSICGTPLGHKCSLFGTIEHDQISGPVPQFGTERVECYSRLSSYMPFDGSTRDPITYGIAIAVGEYGKDGNVYVMDIVSSESTFKTSGTAEPRDGTCPLLSHTVIESDTAVVADASSSIDFSIVIPAPDSYIEFDVASSTGVRFVCGQDDLRGAVQGRYGRFVVRLSFPTRAIQEHVFYGLLGCVGGDCNTGDFALLGVYQDPSFAPEPNIYGDGWVTDGQTVFQVPIPPDATGGSVTVEWESFSSLKINGDVNVDGIGCADDRAVIAALASGPTLIGTPDYDPRADLDLDGDIDGNDLLIFDQAYADEPDCNLNGAPDVCDIASGTSFDCNENGIPDECDTRDGTLSQWANAVSDVSSELGQGGGDWSATQALGIPDASYGHDPAAWAPANQDGSTEYITVLFDEPVHATGVAIVENNSVGFVQQINLIDIGNLEHRAWKGTDTCAGSAVCEFQQTWPATDYLVKGVKIKIYTNHVLNDWEEIDAIRLDGVLGISEDCNLDGVPDECQLVDNDCNENGIPDDCDIASGFSADVNGSGVPDECEPACADADVDCDGSVNAVDLGIVRAPANWQLPVEQAACPRADVNGDGYVNAVDLGVIRAPANWQTSTGPCICPDPCD